MIINRPGRSAGLYLPLRFDAARETAERATASSRSRGVPGSVDRSLSSCGKTAPAGATPRTRLSTRRQLIRVRPTANTGKHFDGASQYVRGGMSWCLSGRIRIPRLHAKGRFVMPAQAGIPIRVRFEFKSLDSGPRSSSGQALRRIDEGRADFHSMNSEPRRLKPSVIQFCCWLELKVYYAKCTADQY